jgi:hypothetical protein
MLYCTRSAVLIYKLKLAFKTTEEANITLLNSDSSSHLEFVEEL